MLRLPNLPKLPDFFRSKKMDIIQRMRLRQYFTYAGILLILIFFGIAIATNMFNGGQKTEAREMADNETIGQLDPTDYSSTDIIIPDNHTVYIDGEHTFKSVTVNGGGKLTSHDYNTYGVYQESDTSRNASNLMNVSPNRSKYLFIMRGYINTGNFHNRSFAVTSGVPEDWSTTSYMPSTYQVDDFMQVNFCNSVAMSEQKVYNEDNWDSSNCSPAARMWADINGNRWGLSPATSDESPLIPFELRFYNALDDHHFGIASCARVGATDCSYSTGRVNYKYLDTISTSGNFHVVPTSDPPLNPEIKTFVAWQSSEPNLMNMLYDKRLNDDQGFYDTLVRAPYKTTNGWSSDYFYRADNFDFRNDKKAASVWSADGTYTLDTSIPQREWTLSASTVRLKSNYYVENGDGWFTPLAINTSDNDYPILSKSLAESLPKKTATVINVPNGEFLVKTDGRVNFNGKGYAPRDVASGSGPGGGRLVTVSGGNYYSGASHSGAGGFSTGLVYDNSNLVDPVFPGSGGMGTTGDDVFIGYGGGMVKINAKKITLEPKSIVSANGMGGNGSVSSGASGGTLIFNDNDRESSYEGMLLARGAECRWTGNHWPGGSNCSNGGGGGGYISINTMATISGMLSRYEVDKSKYFWYTSSSQEYSGPLITEYTGQADGSPVFLVNTIIASGGRNEFGAAAGETVAASWGKYGIVRIASTTPEAALTIRKELVPVERGGVEIPATINCDTSADSRCFNPYALRQNDVIKVILRLQDVQVGTHIEDEILTQPSISGGYYCNPIAASISNGGNADTPGYVIWDVDTAVEGESSFSYECKVIK